jgi:hypothetical protein
MTKKNHNGVEDSSRQLSTEDLLSKLKLGDCAQIAFAGDGEQLIATDADGRDLTWSEVIALVVLLERSMEYRMTKTDWNKWLRKYCSNLTYDTVSASREGFVYIMRNNRNGYCKIGFSEEVEHREKTLQSEDPDIELVLSIAGTARLERELHQKYHSKRLRGEWFTLSDGDIEIIRAYHCQN